MIKLWMLVLAGYSIYLLFFKKDPVPPEYIPGESRDQKDTMLVTYYPREGNGARHEPHAKLTPGAIRLMAKNPKVPKPFDENFLDKNAEVTPFMEV